MNSVRTQSTLENPAVAAVKADYPPDVIISPRTGKPKRRKASRACVHCQRSHVTCDDNRPCERCVARGLGTSCQDGSRKKAKYLNDVSEAVAMSVESKKFDPRYNKSPSNTTHLVHTTPSAASSERAQFTPGGAQVSSSLFALPSSPLGVKGQQYPQGELVRHKSSSAGTSHQLSTNSSSRRPFESSAMTSEYSVLSSILHGNSSVSGPSGRASSFSVSDVPNTNSPAFSDDSSRTDVSMTNLYTSNNNVNQYPLGNSPSHNLLEILATVDLNDNDPSPNEWLSDVPKMRPISVTIADSIVDPEFQLYDESQRPLGEPQSRANLTDTSIPAPGGYSATGSWQRPRRPADIYLNVRSPFPYTPGFHALQRYLRSRFDKPQLIQMAQCMARYRPSFIACTNSLDQDDLVFMEQSFQRTLLEYEKYISWSGTPTVIWRRTGQIAAVGKEFCILTGWSRQQLLDREGQGTGMFVVELMQDNSVLEYFEIFSNISFGDSVGATMSECDLLTPDGQVIKTSCIWTLKRDVFGIPMMIVGNFLPILP